MTVPIPQAVLNAFVALLSGGAGAPAKPGPVQAGSAFSDVMMQRLMATIDAGGPGTGGPGTGGPSTGSVEGIVPGTGAPVPAGAPDLLKAAARLAGVDPNQPGLIEKLRADLLSAIQLLRAELGSPAQASPLSSLPSVPEAAAAGPTRIRGEPPGIAPPLPGAGITVGSLDRNAGGEPKEGGEAAVLPVPVAVQAEVPAEIRPAVPGPLAGDIPSTAGVVPEADGPVPGNSHDGSDDAAVIERQLAVLQGMVASLPPRELVAVAATLARALSQPAGGGVVAGAADAAPAGPAGPASPRAPTPAGAGQYGVAADGPTVARFVWVSVGPEEVVGAGQAGGDTGTGGKMPAVSPTADGAVAVPGKAAERIPGLVPPAPPSAPQPAIAGTPLARASAVQAPAVQAPAVQTPAMKPSAVQEPAGGILATPTPAASAVSPSMARMIDGQTPAHPASVVQATVAHTPEAGIPPSREPLARIPAERTATVRPGTAMGFPEAGGGAQPAANQAPRAGVRSPLAGVMSPATAGAVVPQASPAARGTATAGAVVPQASPAARGTATAGVVGPQAPVVQAPASPIPAVAGTTEPHASDVQAPPARNQAAEAPAVYARVSPIRMAVTVASPVIEPEVAVVNPAVVQVPRAAGTEVPGQVAGIASTAAAVGATVAFVERAAVPAPEPTAIRSADALLRPVPAVEVVQGPVVPAKPGAPALTPTAKPLASARAAYAAHSAPAFADIEVPAQVQSRTSPVVGAQASAVRTPAVKTPAVKAPAAQVQAAQTPAAQTPAAGADMAATGTGNGAPAAPGQLAGLPESAGALVAPRASTTLDMGAAVVRNAVPVTPELAPAVQAPAVQAPAVQAPAVQAPAVQAPAVQAPAVTAAREPANAVQTPAVQAPAVQAPAVQAPAPSVVAGPVAVSVTSAAVSPVLDGPASVIAAGIIRPEAARPAGEPVASSVGGTYGGATSDTGASAVDGTAAKPATTNGPEAVVAPAVTAAKPGVRVVADGRNSTPASAHDGGNQAPVLAATGAVSAVPGKGSGTSAAEEEAGAAASMVPLAGSRTQHREPVPEASGLSAQARAVLEAVAAEAARVAKPGAAKVGELNLDLATPEFGRIRVRLEMAPDGGVRVEFRAASIEGAQAIKDGLPLLRSSLEGQRVTVEVRTPATTADFGMAGWAGSGNNQRQQPRWFEHEGASRNAYGTGAIEAPAAAARTARPLGLVDLLA